MTTFATRTTNSQATMALPSMSENEDTHQALVMLLGEDTAKLPMNELVTATQARVGALEAELNATGTFGMAELEHGMLTKLLAQLLGGPVPSTALH
jgi:hypothetical protein